MLSVEFIPIIYSLQAPCCNDTHLYKAVVSSFHPWLYLRFPSLLSGSGKLLSCVSCHFVVKVSFLFTAIYCLVEELYPRFVPWPSWSLSPCIPIKQHFLALDSCTSCLNKHCSPLLGLTDNSGKLTEIARLTSLFCISSVKMELWTDLGVGNMGTKIYTTFFIQIPNPICHK